MKIKISILMAVKNGEVFLVESINSVLKQSLKDFEFIIIDDASNDRTSEILKRYQKKDGRIRIIKNRDNVGLAMSLNAGLAIAKGKYIARMDHDDISLRDRLKIQYNFLEKNSGYSFCGGMAILINKRGKKIGEKKLPKTYKSIKKVIIKYNPFIHPSLMLRKDILNKMGGYNESFIVAQDYELVLRIMAEYKGVNIDQYLIKYRISSSNISFKRMNKSLFFALKARWMALTKFGYAKWQFIYLLKPLISYFIPPSFKFFIFKRFIWQKS